MNERATALLLASTSGYRKELLQRLGIEFTACAAGVDESERPAEFAAQRALRLAIAKATQVGSTAGPTLVLGSDQVADLEGVVLHKPGSAEVAHDQLRASSGRTVLFHTAVCLLDTLSGRQHTHVDLTTVRFRQLDERTIHRYVEREQPLDCAGSFKCEGLGIALFERIETLDPTALVGLPLIAVARLLRENGIDVP